MSMLASVDLLWHTIFSKALAVNVDMQVAGTSLKATMWVWKSRWNDIWVSTIYELRPRASKYSIKHKSFLPEWLVGEGERLFMHLMWSNGQKTKTPMIKNKQDFVLKEIVLIAEATKSDIPILISKDSYG